MAISSQSSTLEIPMVAIRWLNANPMGANKKCKCDNYTRNNEEKSYKMRLNKEKMSDFAKNTAHNERSLLNISYICSVAEGLRQT